MLSYPSIQPVYSRFLFLGQKKEILRIEKRKASLYFPLWKRIEQRTIDRQFLMCSCQYGSSKTLCGKLWNHFYAGEFEIHFKIRIRKCMLSNLFLCSWFTFSPLILWEISCQLSLPKSGNMSESHLLSKSSNVKEW